MVKNIPVTLKQLNEIKEDMTVADVSVLVGHDSIILPSHKTKIDEKSFIDLLLTSISLTPKDKICVLLRLPDFSQTDVDQLVVILQKEKIGILALYHNQAEVEQMKLKSLKQITRIISEVVQAQSIKILQNQEIDDEEI